MNSSPKFDRGHLSVNEFSSLLQADNPRQLDEVAAEHLNKCRECQQQLEQSAASRDAWAQYATMMENEKCLLTFADDCTQLLEEPTHPEFVGRIGKYNVEQEIGRGGMGVVFRAFDAELHRPLAIKILQPHAANNGTARKRFAAESRAAASVIHPNIMPIHEVSSAERLAWFAMPLISGPTLQEYVDESGPLDEKSIVRIAFQIASGLAAAHAQGIVHRDIKPANLLLDSDTSRVIIADFGLARVADDMAMTQSGCFVGTPNYMSPEQAKGATVDSRSDLFSLGSVIYFLATGHMPFEADTPFGVMYRIAHEDPRPIRELNCDLSPKLESLVERLLQRDPSKRFESTAMLRDQLEKYLAHMHQPRTVAAPQFAEERSRFHRKIMLGLIAAMLAFAAVAASSYFLPSLRSPNNSSRLAPNPESKTPEEKRAELELLKQHIESLEIPSPPAPPNPKEP